LIFDHISRLRFKFWTISKVMLSFFTVKASLVMVMVY
jgi:hypothetical protein